MIVTKNTQVCFMTNYYSDNKLWEFWIAYTCSTAVCIYDLYSCCKDALEKSHKSTLDFLLSAWKRKVIKCLKSVSVFFPFSFFPSLDEKKVHERDLVYWSNWFSGLNQFIKLFFSWKLFVISWSRELKIVFYFQLNLRALLRDSDFRHINQRCRKQSRSLLYIIYFNCIIYDAFNFRVSRHKRIFPLSVSPWFLRFISFYPPQHLREWSRTSRRRERDRQRGDFL